MSDHAKQLLRKFAGWLGSAAGLEKDDLRVLLDTLTREGTDAQKGAFLGLLNAHEGDRLAAVPVIVEAARFLREHPDMVRVSAPEGTIDIVGTGGDGASSFNVSTAAAFVAAGAGVKLDVPPKTIERAIRDAGVGFLWAPQHHPAMKSWGPVRAELGFRTLFNLLGPLCNPAFVKRQVIGVYAREWVRPVAEVMRALGSEHVWVVHGSDGLDELTTTGPSFVAELKGGAIREFEIRPEHAGLRQAEPQALRGGDATENAATLRAILGPAALRLARHQPIRDIVVLNAAAALIVAGIASDLKAGAELAEIAIDSTASLAALDKLVRITST